MNLKKLIITTWAFASAILITKILLKYFDNK